MRARFSFRLRTPLPPEPSFSAKPRLLGIDALRGAALLWMTVYHLCFDLSHFGYTQQNFYADPVWTGQRTGILSLFLLCAGMGQALAVHQGQSWARFWQRWWQIAACAALVSLGSWWMFPRSWISFGVLHGMAVMLPLTRWLLMQRWWRGALPWLCGGALVLAAPLLNAWLGTHGSPALAALLESRWLNGLGLATKKLPTEDWVPLLPWWGVMLWGAALGRGWVRRQPSWRAWRPRAAVPVLAGLAGLGRWSLSYYMLHQPVLIGLLLAWGALRGY